MDFSLVAEGINWKAGENILFYEREFPSNIFPWQNLKRKGVEARLVPFRNGRVQIEDIERLMDSRTRMVTVSSVQFLQRVQDRFESGWAVCAAIGTFMLCVDAFRAWA